MTLENRTNLFAKLEPSLAGRLEAISDFSMSEITKYLYLSVTCNLKHPNSCKVKPTTAAMVENNILEAHIQKYTALSGQEIMSG